MVTPEVQKIRDAGSQAIVEVNKFNKEVFRTRGGRLGSGMGLLLEGLWGYQTNRVLANESLEIAWIVDHDYNDFAVVNVGESWNHVTMEGEYFRIEIKSMNVGAEESKAHFDEIEKNIGSNDELVVLAWRWEPDGDRVWPRLVSWYMGSALAVAGLRDQLHLARGGTFVVSGTCPDACTQDNCSHVGEPLNASGKRERGSGPESCRVSQKVSFASNFGGLVRMVKVRGTGASSVLEEARSSSIDAKSYLDFIAGLRLADVSTE